MNRRGFLKAAGGFFAIAAGLGPTVALADLVADEPNQLTAVEDPFANVTTAPMDIYVSADGSDSNPGTSSKPVATLAAAMDRVPYRIEHNVTIRVGPGNYKFPAFKSRVLDAPVNIVGEGWPVLEE